MGGDARTDIQRDGVDVGLRYGNGDYPDLLCELIARAMASPVCSPERADCYPDPEAIPAAPLLRVESSLVAPGLPT